MSLEAVIQENTNTMRELIAVWNKLAGQAKTIDAKVEAGATGEITAGGKPVAEIKPEKAAKAKAEPKVEAAAPAAEPEQPAATPAAEAAPAIAIADVNAAIIGLAKAKGRDAAVAVLKEFGVAKAPELKPEQYAAVVAAAQKAMA
jgi:antitoxin (DNA-binding transcriptional repressor) of toxin-antitoxin stability system